MYSERKNNRLDKIAEFSKEAFFSLWFFPLILPTNFQKSIYLQTMNLISDSRGSRYPLPDVKFESRSSGCSVVSLAKDNFSTCNRWADETSKDY